MTTSISCGQCRADVPEACHDYLSGSARCPSCGTSLSLADGSPISATAGIPSGVTVQDLPRAQRVAGASYRDAPVRREPAGVRVELRGDRAHGVMLLVFTLLSSPVVLVFASVAFSFGHRAPSSFTALWLALFVGGWLALGYTGVAKVFERTRIELTPALLRASKGPLPWPGTTQLAVDRIVDLGVTATRESRRDRRRRRTYYVDVFRVQARLVDGGAVPVLNAGSDRDRANFVMQTVARRMQEWREEAR